MASINDSSIVFFSKASPAQWSFVFNLYRDVFRTHAEQTRSSRKNGPADLIKLDTWFQDQLPLLIRARKEHQLFYEELVQITKWKLFRGKFRPSLLDLVKTNTETAVKNVTKKAFKKLPNISAAISALTQLKGIGPATASAVLVAYSPDCPFMSDETMISIVEVNDYTLAEYLNYVEKIKKCVDRLRKEDKDGDWTSHKIELALWTHYQIKQYNLNLLENMPLSNETNSPDLIQKDVSTTMNYDEENHEDPSLNAKRETDLNLNSKIDIQNNNRSSQNQYFMNHKIVNVDKSSTLDNNESPSSPLKDDNKDKIITKAESIESYIVANSESNLEDSNPSSIISSNLCEESMQSNKLISVEDDSSSNDMSSTNLNGRNKYKLVDNRIINGKKVSLTTNEELSNSNNQINSCFIKQHFASHHTDQSNSDNNTLTVLNDVSISSSCENLDNINSSEDITLHSNQKKRSNLFNNNPSTMFEQSRHLNNCNEELVNFDDNAVSDCESLSKKQKLF